MSRLLNNHRLRRAVESCPQCAASDMICAAHQQAIREAVTAPSVPPVTFSHVLPVNLDNISRSVEIARVQFRSAS